ncbi:MAG: Fic family protein [Patescibacteria group bacterium]
MNIQQKLKFIQQTSGLTQEQLAQKLGVSFATVNSWMRGRSVPRKKAEERINTLFLELTGQKVIPESLLSAKKARILSLQKQHKNVLEEITGSPDIYDSFLLSLTYNTNSIEGNSLTEPETAAVLFQNTALSNKDIIEQLEVKNHQAAWEFILNSLPKSKKIDEQFILQLHGKLMNGIRQDAGVYRNHSVRIVGANVPTANYAKVPIVMRELVEDVVHAKKEIIAHVSDIHARFEQIHPFSDGNGRIGRLLIHTMLLRKNLPPAVIRQENKRFYYSYLQKAQQTKDASLLEDFICDAVLEGYNILKRK